MCVCEGRRDGGTEGETEREGEGERERERKRETHRQIRRCSQCLAAHLRRTAALVAAAPRRPLLARLRPRSRRRCPAGRGRRARDATGDALVRRLGHDTDAAATVSGTREEERDRRDGQTGRQTDRQTDRGRREIDEGKICAAERRETARDETSKDMAIPSRAAIYFVYVVKRARTRRTGGRVAPAALLQARGEKYPAIRVDSLGCEAKTAWLA